MRLKKRKQIYTKMAFFFSPSESQEYLNSFLYYVIINGATNESVRTWSAFVIKCSSVYLFIFLITDTSLFILLVGHEVDTLNNI